MNGGKLILPNTKDYFSFYGLEEKFLIDPTQLKELFLEKSKLYHPDFYIGDAESQNIAISSSAYNNLAYKTLGADISRASYLLSLKTGNEEKSIQLPQAFLMEMMELNELIDEINDDNRYDIEDQILALKKTALESIRQYASEEIWTSLQIEILKWRYLERLENRLNEA
jgi:molecular chaperone HscB